MLAGDDFPSWLTLEKSGGGRAVLSGTAPEATGTWQVRLQAREARSLPAFQDFTLHVVPANLAPLALIERFELEGLEDEPMEVDIGLLFADGEDDVDQLAIEVVSAVPDDIVDDVINEAGRLVIRPLPDANGNVTLAIRAIDTGGLTAETTIALTVIPVNDPPQALPIPAILADAAATPILRDLSSYFTDVDFDREGDRHLYSIEANSAPEIFAAVSLNPEGGELGLEFAPYRGGNSILRIRATDTGGLFAEETVEVVVPAPAPPELTSDAGYRLNRQTGLLEQTVTLTNNGARDLGGFRLEIGALPEGVTLNNGSTASGAIDYLKPLAVGESVALVLEFFSVDRSADFEPLFTATPELPQEPLPAEATGLSVDRTERLDDGSFLIEFKAEPAHSYEIHYSSDGVAWLISPVPVRAAGNRVQWIDRGPPRTSTPPDDSLSRFYRVREIANP